MKRLVVLTLLIIACSAFASPISAKTVGYLTLSGNLTAEDSAAIAWLKGNVAYNAAVISLDRLHAEKPGVDLLWINIPDSIANIAWQPSFQRLHGLKSYLTGGGKLLLTGFAALLPFEIGIESEKPEVQSLSLTNDWLWDQKGMQGFRGHPVYDGFFGGVYTWDTNVDNVVYRVGYFGNRFPKEGKIVGIEKSYVVIEADNKLMLEYATGKGRCMTIGAFVFFSRPNSKRPHLAQFMNNTISYLFTGTGKERPTYWLHVDNVPRQFNVRTKPLAPSPERAMTGLPASGLSMTRASVQNDYYDIGGLRALVMGRDQGGIDELWVHPFRVVRDFQAGLVVGDSILWLRTLHPAIDVRPESFNRTYQTPLGGLREIMVASFDKPGAVVHYEADFKQPVTMVIAFRADLRWMWPYDERALGDVYYGYDEALQALHVRDVSGDFSCVIGGDRAPKQHLSGRYASIAWNGGRLEGSATTLNQVYHASAFSLGPGGEGILNVAIVGTDMGSKEALATYRTLLSKPADEYSAQVNHTRNLLASSVTVTSPDSEFNALWKWALVGTDRFVATTPRLGTALLAGYSTTARGWDGAHKISGRPGYAWYFGRDSEWSGFAIDDYGDFATVRKQLEFLRKYQDITGKIFHEVSTSGIVHYDASDATPLYIVLAAHYLRASGDNEYLRQLWPSLQKAMEFLYSTDTDGDLLIEDTDVGHGWVEGGKLWPVHTEFYLAGIWGEALRDAGWMASMLGRQREADRYLRDAGVVQDRVNNEFWNPSTGFFNFSKLKDGSYNPEPTVLPASVLYFGWLDDAKVPRMLEAYASNSFTTDWGVRIVSAESPLFGPTGYHYGAVWPLFTGWTALAEYQYGDAVQGFMHIRESMEIKNHWALGFVEEVINGVVYKPTGVCPHQCWSETNILHPGINGMIGWKPDATKGKATLAPQFPADWNRVVVDGLRVGRSVVDLVMERTVSATTFGFTLRSGPPVTIALAPGIADGQTITAAMIDGKTVAVSQERRRGRLGVPLDVRVKGKATVVLQHTGGVAVIPVVPRPVVGDSSMGYRIVRTSLEGPVYTVDLEGRAETRLELTVVPYGQAIERVEGGVLMGAPVDDRQRIGVQFGTSSGRYARQRLVVHLAAVKR